MQLVEHILFMLKDPSWSKFLWHNINQHIDRIGLNTWVTLLWIFCVNWKLVSSVWLFATPWSPWSSPGQNAGMGSLSLLQLIFPTQESNQGLLQVGFFTNWAIRVCLLVRIECWSEINISMSESLSFRLGIFLFWFPQLPILSFWHLIFYNFVALFSVGLTNPEI